MGKRVVDIDDTYDGMKIFAFCNMVDNIFGEM